MRLIDADALGLQYVEKMNELLKATNIPNISEEALGLLCGATLIFHAPTVDVEPVRHGRWMFHDDDHWPWVTCSECGYYMDHTRKTAFCPNCGAKMKGGYDDAGTQS